MNVEKIKQDMMFLAGRLMHRSAQTEDERRAAEFIADRLREYTPDVELDEFDSIDSFPYLFASYYSEFLVVAILAIWWPVAAAVYGLGAFLAYLAEFMGYQVFSRFFPHYESQNVVARVLAPRPRFLFIIHAHYDSGCSSPLSQPGLLPMLRPLHVGIIAAMVAVVAMCGADAIGEITGQVFPFASQIRWAAVAFLLSCAVLMYYVSTQGEDTRGANGNASGVAALLRLASAFAQRPLEDADLWFVATGSNEAWMGGMRHFLTRNRLDRGITYLVNIEGIGAGKLHYLTAEGMLHKTPSNKALLRAAGAAAPKHGATPAILRALPTAAHVPHARGIKTLTLMGLGEDGLPPHWNQTSDKVTAIDEAAIAQAADFAEALLRSLEQSQD